MQTVVINVLSPLNKCGHAKLTRLDFNTILVLTVLIDLRRARYRLRIACVCARSSRPEPRSDGTRLDSFCLHTPHAAPFKQQLCVQWKHCKRGANYETADAKRTIFSGEKTGGEQGSPKAFSSKTKGKFASCRLSRELQSFVDLKRLSGAAGQSQIC